MAIWGEIGTGEGSLVYGWRRMRITTPAQRSENGKNTMTVRLAKNVTEDIPKKTGEARAPTKTPRGEEHVTRLRLKHTSKPHKPPGPKRGSCGEQGIG